MDIRITLKMFEANEAGFKKFGILKEPRRRVRASRR